jgi:hypothetical protein
MHKVQPNIKPINDKTIEPLGSITVVTLWNQGTTNVNYGFGDVSIKLKPGQTVTFDAGANTVFASDSKLYVDFESVGANDVNMCLLQFNKLTQASQGWANIKEK